MTLDEFIEKQRKIYNVGKSAFWADMKVIGREIAKATIESVRIKKRNKIYFEVDLLNYNTAFNNAVDEFEIKAEYWLGFDKKS